MKKFKRYLIVNAVLTIAFTLGLAGPINVLAATSPALVGSAGYSVLGGTTVTCTGSTTTSRAVGVSPGTSITGFPSPCTAGGGTHSNDASAIAAQADILTAFGTLDQTCDHTYGAQDLTLLSPLGPGVYCSTSSFTLSGNLKLTGSGVWIFKTVSALTTSPGSSVTGGDPCNVWWRIGSSATLATTTSFIGNILPLNGVTALETGATLNGRVLAQPAGTVTLDSDTVTGPTCATTSSSGGSSSTATVVPKLPNTGIGPEDKHNISWSIIIPAGVVTILASLYLVRKKRAI
jgi:Ice-binding-like